MELLRDKKLKSAITGFVKTAKNLDAKIHLLACSSLAHYMGDIEEGGTNKGGDLTPLTDLCHAMPRSCRGTGLKDWCAKHANIVWDDKAYAKNGGFVKIKIKDETSENIVFIDDAINEPFWELVAAAKSEKAGAASGGGAGKPKKKPASEFKPVAGTTTFVEKIIKCIDSGCMTSEQLALIKQQLDQIPDEIALSAGHTD